MTLKDRIKSKGMKQSWVASQIGVNYNTFRAYMNNERSIPQDISDKVKSLIDN